MKKFFTLLAACAVVVFLASFGGSGNADYPGGAPAGYTGSPGDGHDCMACHGGTSAFQAGLITSDIPSTGYVPGATYNITATVSGSGGKGFEVSPQNSTGDLMGTLTAGTNNHLTGSGKYVTQNSSVSGATATWTFTWTAPATGSGDVTFYGAFTVSKPVTVTSTLTVSEATNGIAEKNDAVIRVTPNPCNGDFSVLTREKGSVSVYDALGRTVISSENSGKFHLDKSGIYFVNFSNEETNRTVKVIVK